MDMNLIEDSNIQGTDIFSYDECINSKLLKKRDTYFEPTNPNYLPKAHLSSATSSSSIGNSAFQAMEETLSHAHFLQGPRAFNHIPMTGSSKHDKPSCISSQAGLDDFQHLAPQRKDTKYSLANYTLSTIESRNKINNICAPKPISETPTFMMPASLLATTKPASAPITVSNGLPHNSKINGFFHKISESQLVHQTSSSSSSQLFSTGAKPSILRKRSFDNISTAKLVMGAIVPQTCLQTNGIVNFGSAGTWKLPHHSTLPTSKPQAPTQATSTIFGERDSGRLKQHSPSISDLIANELFKCNSNTPTYAQYTTPTPTHTEICHTEACIPPIRPISQPISPLEGEQGISELTPRKKPRKQIHSIITPDSSPHSSRRYHKDFADSFCGTLSKTDQDGVPYIEDLDGVHWVQTKKRPQFPIWSGYAHRRTWPMCRHFISDKHITVKIKKHVKLGAIEVEGRAVKPWKIVHLQEHLENVASLERKSLEKMYELQSILKLPFDSSQSTQDKSLCSIHENIKRNMVRSFTYWKEIARVHWELNGVLSHQSTVEEILQTTARSVGGTRKVKKKRFD